MQLPDALLVALHRVRRVGAITGAGISAESGIPTYRGKGGIYDDPEEGDRTINALSGDMLRKNPAETWAVLVELASRAEKAEPNEAHRALFRIEQAVERFVLLTQNVDGLHRRAGSQNVIEIHGDARSTLCMKCEDQRRWNTPVEVASDPICGLCGGVLRPDVVLFGEMLPSEKLLRIRDELYRNVPDLVLVVGTSAMFPYIVEPVILARQLGKLTVEVNPEATVLSAEVDFSLRGLASDFLPLIADVFMEKGRAKTG